MVEVVDFVVEAFQVVEIVVALTKVVVEVVEQVELVQAQPLPSTSLLK